MEGICVKLPADVLRGRMSGRLPLTTAPCPEWIIDTVDTVRCQRYAIRLLYLLKVRVTNPCSGKCPLLTCDTE